jgi:hypothetical protein
MEREIKKMLKNDFTPLLTRENIIGYVGKRIDRNFLIENIINFNQHFYVCGTTEFVENIKGILYDLGVSPNSLIIEK